MSRITKFAWLFTAIVMLGLTACGGRAAPSPTLDSGAVYTAAVKTAYAQLTMTALAATNTPEPTSTLTATAASLTQPADTNTPLATGLPLNTVAPLTALPTNTPFSLTPIAPTQQSCDNFLFLGDVTIPDGSIMNPGEVFDKTWEVQNTGPCAWNKDYLLAFGWGEIMGNNYWSYFTSGTVNPGDIIEVTVRLTAPSTSGTYNGFWRLQNDRGTKFGIALTVVIKVP
jgi:hypothetical protein